MKLKITKVNNMKVWPSKKISWTGVHFNLDGIDYFLYSGCPEGEGYMALYLGRDKWHTDILSSCWGIDNDLIKFTRKPGCLKYIDKENFIERLKEHKLLPNE